MKIRSYIVWFILLANLILFVNTSSATNLTINIKNPSTYTPKGNNVVTRLKIVGLIHKKTIHEIVTNYPNVEHLDMFDAEILAYTDNNHIRYAENEIPDKIFSKNLKLKTVILPRNVVRIGKGAFWSCKALESVILPLTIKTIDQFSFQLCSHLKVIIFPENLISIGGASFAGCTSLKNIYIHSKVLIQMPEWNPFPNFNPNFCSIYVPAKIINDYKKNSFLSNFKIKALQ